METAEKASGKAHQAQIALQATQARLESTTRELETAQGVAASFASQGMLDDKAATRAIELLHELHQVEV
ncbi:hypothetical protein QF017_000954 [Pseudomonas laurylsulfatiphila]|uniref:hypothetical protein n=1 Tax=Pseudomonas laurylsulfatiphila TaxID=2011015 RepID=UPI003D23611B